MAFNETEFNNNTAGQSVEIGQPLTVQDPEYDQYSQTRDQEPTYNFTSCPSAALENPILTSSDKANNEYFNENFSPFINKHKIVHLRVGSGDTLNVMTPGQEDNWRKQAVNSICEVDPHIVLITPDLNFQFNQDIEYGSPLNLEEMTQKYVGQAGTGLLKKGSDLIDNAVQLGVAGGVTSQTVIDAAGATYSPEYINLKSFKSCKVSLPSSMTFDFDFGKYGLFDGRKEVVEPILALASIFSMQPLTKSGMYKGPVPTDSWMKTQVMINMKDIIKGTIDVSKMVDNAKVKIGDFKEEVADIISSGDLMTAAKKAATSALETAVKIKSAAYGAFNAVAQLALSQAGTRLLTFSVGKQTVGPLYVKTISWNFDFSSVDQYGYPCSGKITFSGLESPHVGSFQTVNTFTI